MFNIECLTNQKFNYSPALSTNEPIGTNKDNGNVKCWTLGVAHISPLRFKWKNIDWNATIV